MAAVAIPRNLPVGYRFQPTDEEFIDHYLKNRVLGFIDRPCVIPDVDICRWDPWELPSKFHGESIIPPDDKVQEWWFFCLQTPQQVTRSTPSGYWKKTGYDRNVKARDASRVIGTKKTLVFHIGRGSKGINTKWVIHEYHLLANNLNRSYVLSCLKYTRDGKADNSSMELVPGPISLADLDSDLHRLDHEDSFPEPWVQAKMNSLIEPPFRPDNPVQVASPDLLQLLQPATRSQNSLSSDSLHFMNIESPSVLYFEPQARFTHYEGPSVVSAQGPSVPSVMYAQFQGGETDESIQRESLFGTSEEDEDFGDILNDLFDKVEDVEVLSEEDKRFGDMLNEDIFYEPPFRPDNRVQVDSPDLLHLLQPATRSQNSLSSDSLQFMNIESPSVMYPVAQARFTHYEGPCDAHARGSSVPSVMYPQFQGGQTDESIRRESLFGTGVQEIRAEIPKWHDERPVVTEYRRRHTISVHRVVPPEDKKGMVENKFNSPLAVPEKPMEPFIHAASVKCCSKNEEPRSGKVKQETAIKNIKPERISLDEEAAKAKNGQPTAMGNRRTRIIESPCSVVPLVQKKGVIQSISNSSHVSSPKPMEFSEKQMTPKMHNSPGTYINRELRFEKDKKKEIALSNVKTECLSLDESAAKAKVLKYREHGSASDSMRKTKSREIDAREKSNSVTASTRPTTKCRKSSTNSPLPNLVNVLVVIFLLLTITCRVLIM